MGECVLLSTGSPQNPACNQTRTTDKTTRFNERQFTENEASVELIDSNPLQITNYLSKLTHHFMRKRQTAFTVKPVCVKPICAPEMGNFFTKKNCRNLPLNDFRLIFFRHMSII